MLHAITKLPAIRDRSVVRSSVIPSAKYSCSGSLERFVKGNTAIDRRGTDPVLPREIAAAAGNAASTGVTAAAKR